MTNTHAHRHKDTHNIQSYKYSDNLIFADDATLTNSAKHISDIETELSEDVGNVLHWCISNDMASSVPKCKAMLLSTKQKHHHSTSNGTFTIMQDSDNIPSV